MFTYRTANGRERTLPTLGVVNDQTAGQLLAWGWKSRPAPWGLEWVDPQTGIGYAISQAEAIRRDRLTPRYRFVGTPAWR